MPNNQSKKLPKFKTEEEERKFWAKHDFTDYENQFKEVKLDLSDLQPSTRPITIRLTESLLSSIKKLARKKDVPYQSLMKIMLSDQVRKMQKLSY